MLRRSCIRLVVLLSCLAAGLAAADGSRDITVSLSIRTWDKGPVEGWGMYLHSSKGDVFAETDATGVAVFHAEIGEADQRVSINVDRVVDRVRTTEAGGNQPATNTMLRTQYYFPYFNILNYDVFVDVKPGQSEYRVELVAQPAVTVKALIVDSNREVPVNTGLVYKQDASENLMYSGVSRGGQLTASGLPKGQPNEVYLWVPPFVYPMSLTAEQTADDVDLGKVLIDYRYNEPAGNNVKRTQPRDATSLKLIDFKTSGFVEARSLLSPRLGAYGLLLISTDASVIVSLEGDDSHAPGYDLANHKEMPDIPAAQYYALPGKFWARDFQVAALNAVRAGRDLTEWGIPKLTIEGGDRPQQFDFDAAAAAQAVQKMMQALAPVGQPRPAASQPAPAK